MSAIPHTFGASGDDAHHGAHDDAHAAHGHHEIGFMKKYFFSIDHKTIGLQFLFVGLIFFVLGGLLAMLVRWQLGFQGHPVPILGAYMSRIYDTTGGTGGWK